MKLKVTIMLVLVFWMTGTFASDIIEVFLKDAVSKPVSIYKSPISNRVIAEIQDWADTISTCFHSVYIDKKSRKRFYVSVYELFSGKEVVRGWVNKEDCAVYLNQVVVGDFDDFHYFAIRFFNKPTDHEPAIMLTSNDMEHFNIKSHIVTVTDAKVVDSYEYPYNIWLRVLVELETGETLNLWTVDYCSDFYWSCECPPATRLQEYDKRK